MPLAAGTVRDISVRAFKLCGLTWFGEFLWFSEAVSNQIMALDPQTGQVEHRIPCPGVAADLTTLDGYLLQVCGPDRCLRGIAPRTGEEVTEFANPRPADRLRGLEATRHGLWLGYENLKLVELRDPKTMSLIDTFPLRHPPAGLTVSDNYLVYADYAGSTINVYDVRERRELAAYSVAGSPTGVTWDGSRVWYCDHGTLQLRAIEVPGMAGR
jgi:glutamine cyclotransferase